MKKCPFCAEDIQDAAIVCKHCQRDLVQPDRSTLSGRDLLVPTAKRGTRWGVVGLVLVVLFLLFVSSVYFGEDHQAFLAFSAQRDAWHQKCDRYRQTPLTDPTAKACNEELKTLVTTARLNGWQ